MNLGHVPRLSALKQDGLDRFSFGIADEETAKLYLRGSGLPASQRTRQSQTPAKTVENVSFSGRALQKRARPPL
ncbi:hypothetical protein PGTUg99_023186 [Puccinia graminis f. sp. tritici]|uniref:Uncharacterized protein n=1 Tax=Puccinia graminis f. sp. tritici TaxID=56615 RepID=A0A5B0RIR0_PUCGR|nr:hypothetical protein PGTUg99_023186 [Puccinia graminis f. sp. tritici]